MWKSQQFAQADLTKGNLRNVDGSFVPAATGSVMVLRILRVTTCDEVLRLALTWSSNQIDLETDCLIMAKGMEKGSKYS